jgi:hypothetical protein
MTSTLRRALVLLLLVGLAADGPVLGQATPTPPASSAPSAAATGPGLTGSWTGRATLTNDWPGFTCRYEGGEDPPAVRLELAQDGGQWKGSVAIDVAAADGSGCPPLSKHYTIAAGQAGDGTLGFTDSGGNEWTLAVRRGEGMLKGLLAWKTGDAPLAEGFKAPGGVAPLARLSGEVRLKRAESSASAGAPVPKITGGKRVGHLGAIVAANVVAAGLLVGVNKIGKSSSQSGVVTCSPRNCIIASIGEPCLCNANVLSGASCGVTASGVVQLGACNTTDMPCQAGLSCNRGICEDRFGACPF